MALVNDARPVGALVSTLGHKLAQLLVDLGNKLSENGTLNHDIVVRDADLAGVERLLPHKTAGSELDVCILGNKGRVLATKLEDDGSQCLGSLLGDDGAGALATGEDNLVKLVLHGVLGLIDLAVDADIAIGVEILVKNLLEDHGRVGRQLRGLEHDAVAGGDGTNNGNEVELDGEVEGANNENDTKRLVADARLHGPESGGQAGDGLVLGPLLNLVGDIDGLVLDPFNFGKLGLKLALVHVLLEGLFDEVGIVADTPVELADLLHTELDVLGLVCAERLADGLDVGCDLVERRRLVRRDAGFGSHGERVSRSYRACREFACVLEECDGETQVVCSFVSRRVYWSRATYKSFDELS